MVSCRRARRDDDAARARRSCVLRLLRQRRGREAWSSGSCDPCPGPTLAPGDVATLGGGEAWKAWSHALVAPVLALDALLALLTRGANGMMGPGGSVLFVCCGAMLAVGLWVLIPRKT